MEEPDRFAAFRLALAFEHPDPDELVRNLPASLFDSWTAFLAMHDTGNHLHIGDPDQFVARTPQAIYDTLKDHLTNGIRSTRNS